MREKTIKEAVKKRLRELGAYQHWPVQNGMGAPCLDCHGCYNGIYFAIETKAPKKKPTPRQWLTINAIEQAGGLVFVIDSLERAEHDLTADNLKKARGNVDSVLGQARPAVAGREDPQT